MSIQAGATVVVQLGSPREQVFGLLLTLDSAGLVIKGLSLPAVDDWLSELSSVGAESATMGLATTFYPMHRVEKILLDERQGPIPAIHDRFEERTGLTLVDFVEAEERRLSS